METSLQQFNAALGGISGVVAGADLEGIVVMLQGVILEALLPTSLYCLSKHHDDSHFLSLMPDHLPKVAQARLFWTLTRSHDQLPPEMELTRTANSPE